MTRKSPDLTGAVVVTPKELTKPWSTSVMQSLQGVVPVCGLLQMVILQAMLGSGKGLTSMNGGTPLIVIDGVLSYII